jgi:glycosyltransferase involved in cell wall biosynthesis
MLYIDVGNTLRGGLRTGIQRVVRSVAYELARGAPDTVRLIAHDPDQMAYFALSDPELIRSADTLASIGPEARIDLDFDAFTAGDVFFEPDSTWTEPLNRGSLFRLLKSRGVIVVLLNHDVIPVLLPQVCHPNTLISFCECIADHLQFADYALTTSGGVERDLRAVARRFLGRPITTCVIRLGADFEAQAPAGAGKGVDAAAFAAAFPELAGLRFLLSVGTIESRKNHGLLLEAFERLDAADAGLVIVGRQGWMSDAFLAAYTGHPAYGKRLFWYTALNDAALLSLYRQAYACVLPSLYEGYGLPAVEALSQGCVTVCSDAGSLPEVTQGHAAIFPSGDGEALFGILNRLYREPSYHAGLRASAQSFCPTSWREAGRTMQAALGEIASGAAHDFSAPLRQMVLLSVQPDILDLSLRSAKANLACIDRIVVLTSPKARAAIQAVATRHFADAVILTDDEVAGGVLPGDHQARNTWLRKQLYRQPCIEPNFLAADEDALTLTAVAVEDFQRGGVHRGYYFLEDMGTWLAGSPAPTSFDRGLRTTWAALREAGYGARAFSSHMPQIINKSLATQIFDRFVVDADGPAYDEWSLYFNVAAHLYPAHFTFAPYATLGWPMRMGDWLPQVTPEQPRFENYYPQNYQPSSMFAGLEPLGDYAEKTRRTFAALARARRVEIGGEDGAGQSVLVITPSGLTFAAGGPVIAGRENVRRILLINGAQDGLAVTGTLEMFLADASGTLVRGETVRMGEVFWLPLLPPERPGLYQLRFFATLDNGVRLETQASLEMIADQPGEAT